jgi:hypothetical protein
LLLIVSCAGHSASTSVDSPGGPGSDAAVDAVPHAPALSCGAGISYCEDFEGYDGAIADGAQIGPWTAVVAALPITVDSVKPHSGTKSLHIMAPAHINCGAGGMPCHAYLDQKNASGVVPGDDMYGRAMVFYSNTGGSNLPIGVHSWFFSSGGHSNETNGSVSMNMGGGGNKLQLNYSPGDVSFDDGTITAGHWHCIQWRWDASGSPPADTAKVWIDGTVAITIPASKGWKFATPWDSLNLGFTHYQTLNNSVEIFIDDFALGSAMIPCLP